MKLVFICSSLEPGRDGVGDYTRRLAAELIRQGHSCRILSLNDKSSHLPAPCSQLPSPTSDLRPPTSGKISAFSVSEFQCLQSSEGTNVPCLRLPSTLSWPERVELARQWVEDFKPDWVSLQFVPFGFHPKGLPLGLPRDLKSIIGSTPLHWMFHELWVLWIFPLSLRKRLLGQAQKFWLRSALKKLKPRVVTTQLPLYQAELKKLGVAAHVLPLHGNIPVVASSTGAKSWLQTRCAMPDANELTAAGFFGAILSTLDCSLFAARLAEMRFTGKKLLVLSAGKLGGEGTRLWNSLEQDFKTSAIFLKLSELNEGDASLYFLSLDHGLTSYPPELMGKSGSVAAMREHGLDVLACGSLGKRPRSTSVGDQLNQPWTVRQSAERLLQQLKTATTD